MSVSYQALLGETAINADSIVVQDLVAEKAVIGNLDVTKDLYVEGTTTLNELTAVNASIRLSHGKQSTEHPYWKWCWKDSHIGCHRSRTLER